MKGHGDKITFFNLVKCVHFVEFTLFIIIKNLFGTGALLLTILHTKLGAQPSTFPA